MFHHVSLFLLFLTTSAILVPPVTTHDNIPINRSTAPVLAQDTLRPEIYGWGIDYESSSAMSFIIWANVTDPDSGILNVSGVVRQEIPTVTTNRFLMSFNGTVYHTEAFSLVVNRTYSIWVEVYDNALNRALSNKKQVDLHQVSDTVLDPTVTFPYVVSGSFLTLLVAVLLSVLYHKRKDARLVEP